MKLQWRSLHAYSSKTEPMLIEVVGPFFENHAGKLLHGFWERHYAGGPHLRIRLLASPEHAEKLTSELRLSLERWMANQPSVAISDYNPEHAAALLAREGINPAAEDLTYRNNVVTEGRYPEAGKMFASDAARKLIEDFRAARGSLAIEILKSPQPRHEIAYKLYLSLALHVGSGSYARGSVSFKSHWEGFFATFSDERVLERVAANYQTRRTRLLSIAEKLQQQWEAGGFMDDPLLLRWCSLLQEMYSKVTALLESGEVLIAHASSTEEVAAYRERFFAENVRRHSAFVEALWADERFMTSLRDDLLFQRPRALVNLLYDLLAALGLTPLEKMALCHHTFRAAEEICACDLNQLLQRNISAVIERHAARQMHEPRRDTYIQNHGKVQQ